MSSCGYSTPSGSSSMAAKIHRHFLIVVGDWKFENWHLYRLGWTHSRGKESNRWRVWKRML